MKWYEILQDRKLQLALILSVLALSVSWIVFQNFRKIPDFGETIEISSEKIILTRKYSYVYEKKYPVDLQLVRLSLLNTNVIEVRDTENRMLNFSLEANNLLVYLNGPARKGTKLDFIVKSEIRDNYPFFNIVHHGGEEYSFHYVSWESYPGKKSKRVLLPSGSHITYVEVAGMKPKVKEREVLIQDQYSPAQKFDVMVGFSLPRGYMHAVQASPPLIQDGNATIRVPVSLYQTAPAIQGDFTAWRSLPMVQEGDYFVFKTFLHPGQYRYQIRYYSLPKSDDSVEKRAFNNKQESMSILDV